MAHPRSQFLATHCCLMYRRIGHYPMVLWAGLVPGNTEQLVEKLPRASRWRPSVMGSDLNVADDLFELSSRAIYAVGSFVLSGL